jgi:hypothetical protein
MIRKNTAYRRFGEIAVLKGYASEADVNKALDIQKQGRAEGKDELIGIIMLKQGMLTNEQLIDILRYYETGQA